jgi:hypothetical protein
VKTKCTSWFPTCRSKVLTGVRKGAAQTRGHRIHSILWSQWNQYANGLPLSLLLKALLLQFPCTTCHLPSPPPGHTHLKDGFVHVQHRQVGSTLGGGCPCSCGPIAALPLNAMEDLGDNVPDIRCDMRDAPRGTEESEG